MYEWLGECGLQGTLRCISPAQLLPFCPQKSLGHCAPQNCNHYYFGNKETSSQQSGAYAQLLGRHWAGTQFGLSRWSVHRSGWVCPGSSGSQSRCTLTGILETQRALTLLGGGRCITWCLRRPFLEECQQGLRHFWSCQVCLGYCPAPRSTEKMALCHARSYNKYQLPPSSRTLQFLNRHFDLLNAHSYFVYVLQYTCSINFLFFCVLVWFGLLGFMAYQPL